MNQFYSLGVGRDIEYSAWNTDLALQLLQQRHHRWHGERFLLFVSFHSSYVSWSVAHRRFSDTFCTSVVNSACLEYDEITYLLTEYAGDANVEAYAEKLLQVWKIIADMNSFLRKRDDPIALPKQPRGQPRALRAASAPSPQRQQIKAKAIDEDDDPSQSGFQPAKEPVYAA